MITYSVVSRPFARIGLIVLFFVMSTSCAYARHEHNNFGGYNSATSRAIDKLDEDAVEEFHIPVLFGVTLKNIVSDFGDPRGGGTRLHEGQDLMAPNGTPIVTPTEAVVTSIGEGESAGKFVYTANPGGESWRYMHLNEIADIDVGDVLKPGDFIGTVGNTGNASGVAAHLHFEVRKGEALDPYPRITKEYSLEEKMKIVHNFFRDIDDEEDMAEFLVSTYKTDFTKALASGYTLPAEIKAALKDVGIVDKSELQKKLSDVMAMIPTLVTDTLTLEDTGAPVALIQIYLIFEQTGPAAQKLSQSGATGYFGPVTAAAIREYQKVHDVPETGMYDATTRKEMIAN